MELFYREYGQGRPLVILHGVLGISDNWVTFAKKIARNGFRVIVPDQRNHGHSPHHPVFNYYALVDDLAGLMEKLSLPQPVILGHSMGGKVAMRYALEHPGAVDRLVIVDTSLRTYVRFHYHLQLIDAMQSIDFNEVGSRQQVGEILKEKIGEGRIVQFLMKNLYWKEKHRLGWRPNLQAISLQIEDMYDGVFFSTRFIRPALFIRGGRSDYIIDEDIPHILTNFPQAEIRTIESGTHWVHADEPDAFFRMVSEFLEKR